GFGVIACLHETKQNCATYTSDTSYVGDSMNDGISYLHVIPVAVGYLSAYFGGPTTTFYPGGVYGAASLGAMGNDQMSSLRVPPGLRVTFCTENSPPAIDVANGTGQCRRINGDFGGTPFVGDAWNDRTSYVKVDYE